MVVSVVDDDLSAREGIVDLLASHGIDARAFDSAGEYLSSGAVDVTDCLVTDMHMPGLSGLELFGTLVAAGRMIRTVLITAFPDEALKQRAMSMGIVCYLPKPLSEKSLLDCVGCSTRCD